jgi:tetratricopeptide (TPR) repeat protein
MVRHTANASTEATRSLTIKLYYDFHQESIDAMPADTPQPEASRGALAPAISAPPTLASKIPYESWLVGILLLAVVLCYANMLTNSFVYDDDQQILENPYVKSWHYLPQIFGTTVWSFVGQAGNTNYYRPLMTFSFLVLWSLFGAVPFGFHLLSLVLHAAVVLLGFYAGVRLFSDWRVAWIAALLFAVHPVHTEAVDWISAYPDLQVALFFLAAFIWYGRPGKPSWTDQLILLAFSALALLSKEPALMFVPLAIFYEHFVRPDHALTTPREKFLRYLPLLALGAVYMALRIALFGKLAPVLQHPQITWSQTIYSALAMVSDYTLLLIWPARLSAFHVFHANTSFTEPRVLIGLLILVIATTATFALLRTAPAVSLSLVWLGFTIAPVMNARWMAANVLTERYLYLPSWGFCWLVAWLLIQCAGSVSTGQAHPADDPKALSSLNWIQGLVLLLLIGLSATATYRRNQIWQDDFSLYTQTLKTDPHAYPILLNLGLWHHTRGEYREAEKQYLLGLKERPDGINALNALGVIYLQQKQYDLAAGVLTRAIAVKANWAPPHFNYGRVLQAQERPADALKEFETAVRVAPLDPLAYFFYAEALSNAGQFPEARSAYQRSIELGPSLDAERGLVSVLLRIGDKSDAETAVRRLIAEYPHDGTAHLQLARLLDQNNHPDEAFQQYREVLETDPANSEAKAAMDRLKTKK